MRKLGIICIVLLFALAVMGPSYAHFSGTAIVDKHVESGLLSVGIRSLDNYCTGSQFQQGQVAGYINCIEGLYKCNLGGMAYAESVDIIACGSSLYFPGCTFEIANGGTIPAIIKNIEFSGNLAGNIGNWTLTCPKGYWQNGTGLASLQQIIRDTPIDPTQKIKVEMQFWFWSKDPVFASGTISVNYCRWNEKY